jgi:hypothetical protein
MVSTVDEIGRFVPIVNNGGEKGWYRCLVLERLTNKNPCV